MKRDEKRILDLFQDTNTRLTSTQIKEQLGIKDPSGTISDLIYFEYLKKNEDGTFFRTNKFYDTETRKRERYDNNYEIVLNKIFTGSFLSQNLGHELINFLVDDEGQRYVYLNPWGKRGEQASQETQYAFHIIESSLKNENGVYELVAVSQIDVGAETCYGDDRAVEVDNSPRYGGHSFVDIFYCGPDSDKAHVYTYKALRLLKPAEGKRIFIKVHKNEAGFEVSDDRNTVTVSLMCNPQHSICYADAAGKATVSSQRNEYTDLEVLRWLLQPEECFLVEDDSNTRIEDIDDEQCFAVINDRTNLEDSTSNQIAYFLQRDSSLAYVFLHDFLGIETIGLEERFDIIREKEKSIDLLFVSERHVVVLENKIDSGINGIAQERNSNGKYPSQLSKYYDHIMASSSFEGKEKHFFVLAPEYNTITQEELSADFEHGDQYILKTYNQLFETLRETTYRPLGQDATELGVFLYGQFLKGIEYISWSKAKQRERTAYIRLKQRVLELEAQENKEC